ncbi:hypothetical protein ScPMuIL_011941 [Solemya velum]
MAKSEETELTFYPKDYWGLDFYFRSFNKMYICDILEMEEYAMFPGAFAYKNHPVYKVDILGIVVRVDEKSKCYIYAVDDGTGVVSCTCWKIPIQGWLEFNGGDEHKYKDLPETLQQRARDLSKESSIESYNLGDLVQMKGKIKVFRSRKEISVSNHCKITDPMFEAARMSELPKIYKSCYDKLFVLPQKVAEEIALSRKEEESGQKSDKHLVRELKDILLTILQERSMTVFFAQSLLENNEIEKLLSSKMKEMDRDSRLRIVLQALTLLEDDGQLCGRCDKKDYFEVLLHNSYLEKAIQGVLQRETTKPKFSDQGCHYFHILDELHKTLQYRKVKKSSVLYCLDKMEAQSNVIRTTQKHYILCGV